MQNQPVSDFADVNGLRLHYLDWGGSGPCLLFLAGMGHTAYIYNRFAPRFTDRFHVLGLTRRGHGDSACPQNGYDPKTMTADVAAFLDHRGIERASLAGHSMANLELVPFAKEYPNRLESLIFLDSAYDRTLPAYQSVMKQNPLKDIPVPGAEVVQTSIEGYKESLKRAFPSIAAVWGEVMDEELEHTIRVLPDGKVIDRMPDEVGQALNQALYSYKPENSCIHVPTLAIYVFQDGSDYLAPEYMTTEQQARVVEFIEELRPPTQQECIDQFRRDVPQARIVVIPKGHHYCFLRDADLVYHEMAAFLAENVHA